VTNHTTRRGIVKAAAGAGAALMLTPIERLFGQSELDVNVILIVCDALRADRLGCYGYKRSFPGGAAGSVTPSIDSLAEKGIVYENCISQASWTQTAMAALLYSAWPVIKGAEHSFAYIPEESRAAREAVPGAHMAAFQANPYMREKIFTRLWDMHKFVSAASYASAERMNVEFDWELYRFAKQGKPFFSYIHYMEPHEPYNIKHPFRGTLTRRDWRYFHPLALCGRVSEYHDDTGKLVMDIPEKPMNAITETGDAYDEDLNYLDTQIASLYKTLSEYGILENTVIIFTADHGQSFGEHGWCGHKQSLYQEEIHVPLIIVGPGLPKAERIKAQVRSVDVMPTIAAFAGVSVAGLSGAPLLPVHRVEAGGNRLAYSCCDYAKFGDVYRLLTCFVTKERMKYIRISSQGRVLLREELFDLAADPGEKHDLAAERPELVKEISAEMTAFEEKNYWKWGSVREENMDKAAREQLEALGYLGD
jgi:arylsulfatase